MRLTNKRRFFGPNYTIGSLLIDDKFFCDTLEDPDRGLTSNMSVEDILKVKVKGNTCIPYGTYVVSLDILSSKYSNLSRYKYAAISKGKMPRLLNVKGFSGILIHAGNTPKDTEGCILVGYNKVKGQVIDSQATWTKLYKLMLEAHAKGEPITLEVTR